MWFFLVFWSARDARVVGTRKWGAAEGSTTRLPRRRGTVKDDEWGLPPPHFPPSRLGDAAEGSSGRRGWWLETPAGQWSFSPRGRKTSARRRRRAAGRPSRRSSRKGARRGRRRRRRWEWGGGAVGVDVAVVPFPLFFPGRTAAGCPPPPPPLWRTCRAGGAHPGRRWKEEAPLPPPPPSFRCRFPPSWTYCLSPPLFPPRHRAPIDTRRPRQVPTWPAPRRATAAAVPA